MNEKENETTPNTPEENLDYSFDFAGKVEEETPATEAPAKPETPAVEIPEPAKPEAPATPVVETPATPIPDQPTVDVSVPVLDENAQEPGQSAPAKPEVAAAPQAQPAPAKTEEELKDSKSTTRFVIIIAVIIVAAIIALPFVFDFIG